MRPVREPPAARPVGDGGGRDRPAGGATGPADDVTGADDGRPDARLAAAVAADDGSPAARGEVLAALATARVFLALAADALGTQPSAVSGLRQESAAQMSLLSLVSSRGARALPAFLDGTEVQRWRPQARPVPVAGPLACRTVLDDGAVALLLDPAGRGLAVTGAALTELAAGRVPVVGAPLSTRAAEVELVAGAPVPPDLVAALAQALADEPVTAARLLAGPDGPVLGVVTDLAAGELAGLAVRVRARLGDRLPAAGLDLAVVPAEGPGQQVPLARRRRWRRG